MSERETGGGESSAETQATSGTQHAAVTRASPTGGSMRFRIGALVILGIIAVVIAVLVLRDNGNDKSSSQSSAATAQSVTKEGLASFAASTGHPVYWLGPRAGTTYEVRRDSSGVYVRYLPSGVAVGSKGLYPTVATYPFPGAYAALVKVARGSGLTPIRVPGGGIGVPAKGHPQSVHVGFPGVDYQLEVFEPMSGAAAREVKSGRIVAVGGTTPSQSATKAAATATQLKALPKTVGHAVYWIGARKGNTYELTRNADGSIVIRYLPAGDKVGSQKAYLAVATYPYPSPVAALKALATSKKLETIELAGGGIAVIDPKLPHNVHLAFPGQSYQIEVYAPQDGQVAKIVRAGRVSALG